MMRQLWILFGLDGRIGRAAFGLGIVTAAALFVLLVRGSLSALPLMAEVLAPHGINAGFALNAIWSLAGFLLVWSLIAVTAKRLRDRGRSPWWGVVVVLPLAALVLINDAIFLVSRSFTLPPQIQWALFIDSAVIGLWVLAECLFGPSFMPPTRAAVGAQAKTETATSVSDEPVPRPRPGALATKPLPRMGLQARIARRTLPSARPAKPADEA